MTQEEFDSLVQRVTNALQGSSNMATDLRVVKSPIGVNLLPGILSGELVTLEAASLMGTDGKTPLFEVGAISSGLEADASITLSGTDPSGNPIYKIGLVLPKGDSGKNPILEFEGISTGEPDTDATASFKENGTTEDGQPKYKLSLTIPRGSKGDKGNDGKTPVMEAGSVSKGLEPSVSIIPNGDDPLGNPKYKIDLVLPQGDAGKNPILEFSEIVTGAAGSEASAVFTPVGQTPEGNPKYSLKLTIPRGDTGLPGTGSGNVSVNGSDLIRGKQYLFIPSSDGSTEGSFVEYIPFNDTNIRQEIVDNLEAAKTYTNEQIAGIVQFDIVVVEELPNPGTKGIIYLITKEGLGSDVHNEYIWIESKNDYELIGTTAVDLTDYYTKLQAFQTFQPRETAKRLMSDEEGEKLKGIEEGANKFEYPTDPVTGLVLTWGENGALWGSPSNGSNPLILGKIYGITSTTDQSVMDAVLNGSSIQDLLDAAITSRPIHVQGITSGDYSVVRSIESREDGRIVITFDMFVSTGSPSYKKIEYVAYIRYNNTTKAIIQIFTIGQVLGGFENGSETEIPMNCNNVYASINSSTDISPALTLNLFGELLQGAETTAIIKNNGSSDLVISGILPDTSNSFFNGKSITLCDPLPDMIPQNNYVELNIKYFNNRFYVRVSPIFEE